MGELLLCNEPIAAMPYYMESIGINIYSIEELCYYISANTFLLDKDFMNEELCTWIEKEAHLQKLAIALRDIMHGKQILSAFVEQILNACGYCTRQEIVEILSVIRQMEEKSDFECMKLRADKLMEKKRYLSSIYEYRRLLDKEEVKAEKPPLIGNIWHNLGTAYARLYLFEEAAKCYETAYSLNENVESVKECLFAYRCLNDEEQLLEKAKGFGLDDVGLCEIRNELSIASRSEEIVAFEEKLQELADLQMENKSEYRQAVVQIIYDWKENYRKISKI